uniref:Syntaphilin a n=1 Tax=Fundulus heteroclitus TaxID=8078 RepID=A0A3Q2R4G7_FUNHE
PPAPEQYLTPLQQKEVCIRHLRARLRENVERLQHRDYEIEELRTQLNKLQEDWIKEECHRLEAQLALKEARKEIQTLNEVVESVKSNISVHEQDPHDYKPYSGFQGARPGGKSRSCGCSPASTLSRGTTLTRRSSEALQLDRSPNAPEPSAAARSAGQTHLLLEAALLSEQLPQPAHTLRAPPAVSRSPTFERLCSGGASSAEQLSVISLAKAELKPSEPRSSSTSLPPLSPPDLFSSTADTPGGVTKVPLDAHIRQPRPVDPLPVRQDATVVEIDEDNTEGANVDGAPPELSHWSRYFLVDLLALAMPVVPTMAWLCRGAPQEVMPVYHIGSMLRGCCAVALHSLRRSSCRSRSTRAEK